MVEAKKHIENLRHIQNTIKHLLQNVLFGALYNPDIFGALVYSLLWDILKSKHIQNPAKYLRWSILLRTLLTIANLDSRYIKNFGVFRTRVCQLCILHGWAILLSVS